ncbi:MAG: metallophosphoesterase family protein [bacterium]
MKESTYKVVAIADVHMSNKLPYARPTEDGRTDRLDEQVALWEAVSVTAVKEKADAILILGDLFDKSLVDAVTLTATVEAIVAMPCDVWILPGNHDASTITGGRFTVEAFDAMKKKRVHVFKPGETRYINEWLRFHPVPFCPSEDAMTWINGYQSEIASSPASGMDVLLLHHSIVGCEHLGWTCDQGLDSELICEGFDAVFAGHFHEHQKFGPDLQGMYLGAPMHHNYGDVGRGAQFWVITFAETGKITTQAMDPNLPKFFKAELDDELNSVGEWDPTIHMPVRGDFVRYEVWATAERWTEIKPRVVENVEEMRLMGIRASFKHKPIRAHGVRFGTPRHGVTSVSMEGFVKKYVEVAWDSASHSAEDNAAILGIGLNILGEVKDAS